MPSFIDLCPAISEPYDKGFENVDTAQTHGGSVERTHGRIFDRVYKPSR